MIEQFIGRHKQRRRIAAVGLLLLLVVIMPGALLAGGPDWVIDSTMVPRMGMPTDGGVSGLVAFGMEGADADAILKSAEVYTLTRRGWRSTRMGNRQIRWRRRGYENFLLSADGYRPIRLDSLRISADSLTIVTATLQPGTDTMSLQSALECCLTVRYKSLDEVLPQNSIVGTVTDDCMDMLVAGADVYCEELKRRTTTDTLGKFTMPLDLLKQATLHVWHPLYDSIRFEVRKNYLWTQKPIQIHFESQRSFPSNRLCYTDSSALFISTFMRWSSGVTVPLEFKDEIYTHAVKTGGGFGPTSYWGWGDSNPFRLLRTSKDRRTRVQIVHNFGLRGDKHDSPTNSVDVSDTAVDISVLSDDAGTTVSLQLQPDYTPQRSVFQDWRNRWAAADRRDIHKKAPCDSICAEVERVHLQNFWYLMTHDFEKLVAGYSKNLKSRGDAYTPSVQIFERIWIEERMKEVHSSRMAELFDLRRAEAYVHGVCNDPMSDQYLIIMERCGHEPKCGDVLVQFVSARWSPWGGGWNAVYRKEEGNWKILTMF